MIGAGLRIAQQASNGFERLLATGLTTLLGFQAFIIMAGVMRLLPLTGVTLRSSPTAARRCSPTGCSWRSCCASPNTAAERDAERAAAGQLTEVV